MRSGYIVLTRESDGRWREVGEVKRKPGLAARASRLRAIEEVTGGNVGEAIFAVLPLSEWRLACDVASRTQPKTLHGGEGLV
jgi:hypothetical protein